MIASTPAEAQVPARAVRATGYAFVVPAPFSVNSGSRGSWQIGGGGEVGLPGRKATVDVEYAYAARLLCGGCRFSGVNLMSLNAIYRRPSAHNVRPFVTYGYTAGFVLGYRSGFINLVNLGAGLDAWIGRSAGIRTELRGIITPVGGPICTVRVGVVFR